MWVQEKMVPKHKLPKKFPYDEYKNYKIGICELDDHVGEKG
jgi:hypothetical protein